MSATAGLAKQAGFEVEGSDAKEVYSPSRDILENNHIAFSRGYDKGNIEKSKAGLFIISAGEGPENPEVAAVYEKGFQHCSFAELLYELSREKLRVVITGTKGKSTTTAMLGHLLKGLDDSSFMAGAALSNYGSNFYMGNGHYFVFEGDEYKSEFDDPTPKFHYYKPDILILTNLEFDHPDVFETYEQLEQEFEQLIQNMPEDGLIVYNADDPNLTKLAHKTNISTVSFSIDEAADFKVESIQFGPEYTTFDVYNKYSSSLASSLAGLVEQYKIQLPGKINVYNALACIAALRSLGFSQDSFLLDLLSFKGIKRRFEVVGTKAGITVVDDYAHHPTAVRETLNAAKLKYGSRKIWAVFEPHTFSRTKALLPELSGSFGSADEVLVSEIYPAREKAKDASITSSEVIEVIKKNKPGARLVAGVEQAKDILKAEAKSGDVVVVMAVGNFNRLSYELMEIL